MSSTLRGLFSLCTFALLGLGAAGMALSLATLLVFRNELDYLVGGAGLIASAILLSGGGLALGQLARLSKDG
ncbi:MAG: hypothetical protein H7A21_13715 [Spirochaetales bacterium]|nr:hypothetical protein [Leptospiraceae bacterium]MCP5482488.1 hypothetical protein [Spirochaetales bacterium]MCP5485808.1 hypothetical protein [Spirochaetales bacterium]